MSSNPENHLLTVFAESSLENPRMVEAVQELLKVISNELNSSSLTEAQRRGLKTTIRNLIQSLEFQTHKAELLSQINSSLRQRTDISEDEKEVVKDLLDTQFPIMGVATLILVLQLFCVTDDIKLGSRVL